MSQARQRKRATAPVPALSFYAASPAVALSPLDAENPSSIAEPPSSEPDATASAPVALKTYASRRRRDQEASTCPSLSSEASLACPAGHLSAATLIKAGKRRRLEDAHCDDESIPPVLQDILRSSTSAPPLERTQVHRMPSRSREEREDELLNKELKGLPGWKGWALVRPDEVDTSKDVAHVPVYTKRRLRSGLRF
jgi:hypothetical protein